MKGRLYFPESLYKQKFTDVNSKFSLNPEDQ